MMFAMTSSSDHMDGGGINKSVFKPSSQQNITINESTQQMTPPTEPDMTRMNKLTNKNKIS